jgi:rubrerythrin
MLRGQDGVRGAGRREEGGRKGFLEGRRTMGEPSSVDEVIELAITREIQAAEFYTTLAGRVAEPSVRSLFQRLAQEELEHKGKLELEMVKEGFVARTAGRLIDVGLPDYAAELEVGAEAEYKDVLAMAIRKERRSFRFYVQLAAVASEAPVHEVFLELAEEEARHLVQFEAEYNRVTSKPQ